MIDLVKICCDQVCIPRPAAPPPLLPDIVAVMCLLSNSGDLPLDLSLKSGVLFCELSAPRYGELIPGLTTLLRFACLSFLAASLFSRHSFVSGLTIAHFGHNNSVVSAWRNAVAVLFCPSALHQRSIQYRSQPSSRLSRQISATRPTDSRVYFSETWRQWCGFMERKRPRSGQ
jgi:hypothetical protein